MKIGIVGAGMVGATCAFALVMRGIGREIVIVDVSEKRAQAQANDIFHAVPFTNPMTVRSGSYADLKGCRIVIIAAGVSQRPDESRIELLDRNVAVFEQVVPAILKHDRHPILLVATNPVDIMTHITARFGVACGAARQCVIGTGTTLDTARFRALIGRHLGVDPHHVHGYVLGEHGDTEVLAWSMVTVAGMSLEDFCRHQDVKLGESVKHGIERQVRFAADEIISGKGATCYGIAAALAKIVDVIIHDQRSVLTVCAPVSGSQDLPEVTLSLPRLVGGSGAITTLHLPLNTTEEAQLMHSAHSLRQILDQLSLPGP